MKEPQKIDMNYNTSDLHEKTEEINEKAVTEECNDIKTQMELLREIFNYTLHEADCAYEWVDAFKMLGGPVTRFNSNIDSVVDILNRLEESERSSGFINGMLFSSIYSAYEGFIHEMFEIYCKMENISCHAQEKIKNLNKEEKEFLQFFLKKYEKKPLAESLAKITLNDSSKISFLSSLFGIKLPALNEVDCNSMRETRNIFVHYAGIKNGELIPMDSDHVYLAYKIFSNLINDYINAFENYATSYPCK